MSLIFGNSGPYLCITRYVDEQGTSHLTLLPGLNIASHNLRACDLLPSLEKLKANTVLIAEGGSCDERRRGVLTEAGHFHSYRKGNYFHFTDTENNPQYTIDIQNISESRLLTEIQQVSDTVLSVAFIHSVPGTGDRNIRHFFKELTV